MLRVDAEVEIRGLDHELHGGKGYYIKNKNNNIMKKEKDNNKNTIVNRNTNFNSLMMMN